MALPTQLRAIIAPVAVGQADIQYDRVKTEGLGAEAFVRFAQGRNPDGLKFLLGQLLSQKVAKGGVIFDDQNWSFGLHVSVFLF